MLPLELHAAPASAATQCAILSALRSGATAGSGLDLDLASRIVCSSLDPPMLTLNFIHRILKKKSFFGDVGYVGFCIRI